MLDTSLLSSVAKQLLTANEVEVEGRRLPVCHTSRRRLRMATFTAAGCRYTAIEQNPEKLSPWGRLARSGHQVVQFRDAESNKFVAVAVDGDVKEYGTGKSRGQSPATQS